MKCCNRASSPVPIRHWSLPSSRSSDVTRHDQVAFPRRSGVCITATRAIIPAGRAFTEQDEPGSQARHRREGEELHSSHLPSPAQR
eukprot:753475-Hanusia_phi.AAC.2